MMTDPIADMLTRIRNASRVKKPETVVPFSKLKFNIARILEREGYIEKVEERATGNLMKEFVIYLKYGASKKPRISGIRRISKPGQRLYVRQDNIPVSRSGFGIAILSTSRGLMTDKEARNSGVGGEILCEVY